MISESNNENHPYCPCGQVLDVACDCSDDRGMSPSEPTDEVVDRMMIDEKFYDNIVGWF